MPYTKSTTAIFDKYANQYQGKYMDMGMYKYSFDLFCDLIKKENAEV